MPPAGLCCSIPGAGTPLPPAATHLRSVRSRAGRIPARTAFGEKRRQLGWGGISPGQPPSQQSPAPHSCPAKGSCPAPTLGPHLQQGRQERLLQVQGVRDLQDRVGLTAGHSSCHNAAIRPGNLQAAGFVMPCRRAARQRGGLRDGQGLKGGQGGGRDGGAKPPLAP